MSEALGYGFKSCTFWLLPESVIGIRAIHNFPEQDERRIVALRARTALLTDLRFRGEGDFLFPVHYSFNRRSTREAPGTGHPFLPP